MKITKREKVLAGLRIAELRQAKGLTQAELQRRCGLESPRLHKYESGKSYPDIPAWRVLARELKVSLDTLIGVEPFDVDMTEEESVLVAAELPRSASPVEREYVLRGIRRARMVERAPDLDVDEETRAVRERAAQEYEEGGGEAVRSSSMPPPVSDSTTRPGKG